MSCISEDSWKHTTNFNTPVSILNKGNSWKWFKKYKATVCAVLRLGLSQEPSLQKQFRECSRIDWQFVHFRRYPQIPLLLSHSDKCLRRKDSPSTILLVSTCIRGLFAFSCSHVTSKVKESANNCLRTVTVPEKCAWYDDRRDLCCIR